ncbi:MAG: hypothetical protein ABIJ45_05385 [Candidatus Zixiibacteriota bacterium]
MRRLKRYHLYLLTIICLIISNSAIGGDIEAEILQYKLGRFYFGPGTEADIYENCPFIIYSGADSIGTGRIEKSFPGISFSYPDRVNYDTLLFDSIHILISPAEIDSLAIINIGILDGTEISDFLTSSPPSLTIYGNRINIIKYNSFFEMTLALESGKIDIIASYKNFNSRSSDLEYISKPADYFAAMIPNVESNLNIKGILTNSLYYRYNPELFSIYYDGDKILSYNRLIPIDSTTDRFIEYNPAKGKNLLRSLTNFNGEIDIAPSCPALKKLSDYFEDILARDKISIKPGSEDIILAFIPIERNNPGAGLDSIFNIMLRAAPLNGEVETNLALIENYIDNGNQTIDTARSLYYYGLAEKSLIEEFGVFPLYRPMIYFAFSSNLKNQPNNPEETFDLETLKVIKPIMPNRDNNK